MSHPGHVSAPPGQLYWRRQVCPFKVAKVLLHTIGGTCVEGHWYGAYGFAFTAWCPLPQDGTPAPSIQEASLRERLRFAWRLIFHPAHMRHHPSP